MSGMTGAFWIDWDYDFGSSDTGTRSRYGNYLYQHEKDFRELDTWGLDDISAHFAATAWRVASGPIMSPPFVRRHERITSVEVTAPPLVRRHPRITRAEVSRSDWNGELIADVGLVAPCPSVLAHAKPTRRGYYHDRTRNAWGEYDGIGEEDLSRCAYLVTETRALWELPAGTVPTVKMVPTGSDALLSHAVDAVEALVAALNREINPLIELLDGGR